MPPFPYHVRMHRQWESYSQVINEPGFRFGCGMIDGLSGFGGSSGCETQNKNRVNCVHFLLEFPRFIILFANLAPHKL